MKLTRISALIVALTLLFSLASPPRAKAISDDAEVALWIVGGVAAFIGLIIVGTYLTRDTHKMFLVEPPEEEGEAERRIVVGLECRGPDGQPALLCW